MADKKQAPKEKKKKATKTLKEKRADKQAKVKDNSTQSL